MNLDLHPSERIQWIINQYYQGHPKRLADAVGVAPATFSQLLNRGAFPSWKVIVGILELHPEVNPDWFLHGEGPKTRDLESNEQKLIKKNQMLRKIIEDLTRALDSEV